ncbi:MAG: hypothetical protein F6K11_32510 [Leptolyngbya sp. SIO3F4]|nr:hypothetical protein [Leptolyngbya sp. SIO3F4]
MRTHHQDEVKVAVYSANMPVPQEQRSQDIAFAFFLLSLAALTGLGLGQFF